MSLEMRTNDGRNMKRPSNLHGYSGSSPFLSPISLGLLVFVGVVKEGSVGHLNACNDVDDEVDAGWNVLIGGDGKLRGGWKPSVQGRCMDTKEQHNSTTILAEVDILVVRLPIFFVARLRFVRVRVCCFFSPTLTLTWVR